MHQKNYLMLLNVSSKDKVDWQTERQLRETQKGTGVSQRREVATRGEVANAEDKLAFFT